MKFFLVFILAMFVPAISNADTVSCSPLSEVAGVYEGSIGLEKKYIATCDQYAVELSGVGLNLEGETAHVSGITVNCPFVRDIRGTYYGLSAKAAILIGVELGAFASQDGVCFLVGGTIAGLGASLNGLKLEVF